MNSSAGDTPGRWEKGMAGGREWADSGGEKSEEMRRKRVRVAERPASSSCDCSLCSITLSS